MSAFLSSNPPGRNQAVSFDHLVELLAPALGREKSRELIGARARSLGHTTDALNLQQALAILAVLGDEPGIVGVSARLAKTRLVTPDKKQSKAMSEQRGQASAVDATATSIAAPSAKTIRPEEIVELLAHSLGTEKSREVVGRAISELGFPDQGLTASQAQATLESVAKSDGIVGVTARFAKARLLLRFQ